MITRPRVCAIQPRWAPAIDWSNPIVKNRRLLDAWLPQTMAFRSVLGRKPVSTGPIGLKVGKFGIGAHGLSKAVQYDVGEWAESGPYCFVAICSFYLYSSTCSLVRKDGADTPVQIANDTVRGVGFSPVQASDNYYSSPSGNKHNVLVSNRESASTRKMYRDGDLVVSNTGLTAYGSTSNPLCFLGTEGDSEIFTSAHGLFFGGFAFSGALTELEIKSISRNPWQIFKGRRSFLSAVATVQFLRPISDISNSGWAPSTGADLFAMLDETIADDADYIGTTYGSTCEVGLGSLADPGVSSGHKVRYRIAADAGAIVVRLRQGATTIASWTHNPAPTSLTTFEQTLSGAEADSITDYSALKLQFEAY